MVDVPASPLVLTKLRVPASRPRIVPRTRLVEQFSPETDSGLVLVCAPAGYGKTTLVTEWSHTLIQKGMAVAWYALDSGDNDPILFGSYLVASLARALDLTSELAPVTQLLSSSPEIDLQRILPAIINAIVLSDRDCALILDDYHLISSPAIHSAVALLLERLPERMHVVISSRSDPPLPLARLRANGQLLEIRSGKLRFTTEETEEFLNGVMQLGLLRQGVAALEDRTEGWIAGLQLAALSLSGRSDRESFIASFSGNNRSLVEYLLEEVVSRQPEPVQQFLQVTSVLERMCGPLCDALLGDHSGSQAILEQLERINLFLVPLDDQEYWYRYHHLFRDFLRTRLQNIQPEHTGALHRAASVWFASQGLLREAVSHALLTDDWAYAAEVVEQHGMSTLMHSEISTVYEWCAAFPEEILRAHPMLCVLQGWTLVLGYRCDYSSRVEQRLQMAERAAAALEDRQRGRWLAGQAAVVRAFIGNAPNPRADPQEALALAQRALDLLPPGDPLRSTTTLTIGYAHMARQEAQAAYDALDEAARLSLAGQNYYGVVEAIFHQARLAHSQGQLRRAAEICRQGQARISAVVANAEQELPAVGSFEIELGSVLLEQNRLLEAERSLSRGLDLIGLRTGIPYYQMIACVGLFRLREIQGRSTEALQSLDRLQEIWPDIRFCTQGLKVLHALRIAPEDPGTLAAANTWCNAFSSSFEDSLPLPGIGPLGASEAFYLAKLAWVRAQIAVGKPEAALLYLERQIDMAEKHGLMQRVIELSLAKALARKAQGKAEHASRALERAVEMAESETCLRVFDQGPAMTALLREAAKRSSSRDYVRRILAVIEAPEVSATEREAAAVLSGAAVSAFQAFRPEFTEPISEREQEVLCLMARGASNHEIAERLVITVGTVKSHINHILVKLNVHNRTEAVARARELNLLEI
jgi:LuxR family maltose regulon positive regulatory protein